MAPKLYTKPLAASVKERLRAKGAPKSHRIAPPTAQQIASVHRLPVPQPVVEPEPVEPMAAKKKRKKWSKDEKARIVARALKAVEAGEAIRGIAAEEGLSDSGLYYWVNQAKGIARKANGAPTEAVATSKRQPSDLKSLSRELAEAMDRVTLLKKRMRKLLGAE